MVIYQYDYEGLQVAVCKEGDLMKIGYSPNNKDEECAFGQLRILAAVYNCKNVVGILESKIQDNSIINLKITDDLFGNPPGDLRKLLVFYKYGGSTVQKIEVEERQELNIQPIFPQIASVIQLDQYFQNEERSFAFKIGRTDLYVTEDGKVRLNLITNKFPTFFKTQKYVDGQYFINIDGDKHPELAGKRLCYQGTISRNQLSVINIEDCTTDNSVFTFYYFWEKGFVITPARNQAPPFCLALLPEKSDDAGTPLAFQPFRDPDSVTEFTVELTTRPLLEPPNTINQWWNYIRFVYKATLGFAVATGSLPFIFGNAEPDPGWLPWLRTIEFTKPVVDQIDITKAAVVDYAKGRTITQEAVFAASMIGLLKILYDTGYLWTVLDALWPWLGPTLFTEVIGAVVALGSGPDNTQKNQRFVALIVSSAFWTEDIIRAAQDL